MISSKEYRSMIHHRTYPAVEFCFKSKYKLCNHCRGSETVNLNTDQQYQSPLAVFFLQLSLSLSHTDTVQADSVCPVEGASAFEIPFLLLNSLNVPRDKLLRHLPFRAAAWDEKKCIWCRAQDRIFYIFRPHCVEFKHAQIRHLCSEPL